MIHFVETEETEEHLQNKTREWWITTTLCIRWSNLDAEERRRENENKRAEIGGTENKERRIRHTLSLSLSVSLSLSLFLLFCHCIRRFCPLCYLSPPSLSTHYFVILSLSLSLSRSRSSLSILSVSLYGTRILSLSKYLLTFVVNFQVNKLMNSFVVGQLSFIIVSLLSLSLRLSLVSVFSPFFCVSWFLIRLSSFTTKASQTENEQNILIKQQTKSDNINQTDTLWKKQNKPSQVLLTHKWCNLKIAKGWCRHRLSENDSQIKANCSCNKRLSAPFVILGQDMCLNLPEFFSHQCVIDNMIACYGTCT